MKVMFLCCGLEKVLQLLCLHPWKAVDTEDLPLFGKQCFLPLYEVDGIAGVCKETEASQKNVVQL